MSEYGQVVAHGTGGGASGSGGSTDVGGAIWASVTDALNQASATTGLPPAILAVIIVAALLFTAWFVFAR